MTRRQRAFWTIAVPVAAMLAGTTVASVRSSPPNSRWPAARASSSARSIKPPIPATTSTSSPAAAGWRAIPRPPTSRATADSRRCRIATTPSCTTFSTKPRSRRAAPRCARSATTTRAAWIESAIESKGMAPLKPELDRVAAIKTVADIPPVVGHLHTARLRSVLRLRRGARLQGRDAVHRDLRPGRARASRSRLLPEGRREFGEAARGRTCSTSAGCSSSPAMRRIARPPARRR